MVGDKQDTLYPSKGEVIRTTLCFVRPNGTTRELHCSPNTVFL